MRINEPNRIGMVNPYNKTNTPSSPKSHKLTSGRDEVQISSEALELLHQIDESSEEKMIRPHVYTIKQQVEAGTYWVPADKIADKFIAFWKKG